MPRLITMRLGNDHTSGTSAGRLTPLAMAADNDYALGMIVEAVSKSRFWSSTVICVLEDDAQNGPDHVDSHRSPALLISSFIKRHTVDSNMYNTASMLRTMEFLLGLHPMTQFDAAARPMSASFQADTRPGAVHGGEASHSAGHEKRAYRAGCRRVEPHELRRGGPDRRRRAERHPVARHPQRPAAAARTELLRTDKYQQTLAPNRMPQIHLCFLWHMHQPFYKDLISGEYKLPWTRMHALKDYYGMVHLLEEFPEIRQTFNLVPSLMAQVAEYASGKAADPFLQMALKPAESLTDDEKEFLLRHSFYSDPQRMIYRYPRYGELFDAWRAQKDSGSRSLFGAQEFRDLQMWSQLAWFDEEFQAHDPEVSGMGGARPRFHVCRPAPHGREAARHPRPKCCPNTRSSPRTGQIEISTTPYYHPILPLLCDSNIAAVSHPGVPLPPRFQYPQDARRQLAHVAQLHPAEFRRRAGGVVAVGRVRLRRGIHDRGRAGIRMGGDGQWRAQSDTGARRRSGGAVSPVPVEAARAASRAAVPRSLHERSDRVRVLEDGRGGRGRRFSAPHSRELLRDPPVRARRAGAHHPRRRECLGILLPQRAAVPARTVPAHLRTTAACAP